MLVSYVPGAAERQQQPFVVADFVRRLPLLLLTTLFVGALALVTGWPGVAVVRALVGSLGILLIAA